MANPFYVAPVDVSPLARSIADLAQQRKQEKAMAAQKQRQEQALGELKVAMQEGPAAVSQFALKYPEMAQFAEQRFGFTNEQSKQAARQGYSDVLLAETPEQAAQALEQTAPNVIAAGGTPIQIQSDAEKLRSGELTLEQVKSGVALAQPDLYKAYQSTQLQQPKVKKVDISDAGVFTVDEFGNTKYQPLPEEVMRSKQAEAAKKAAEKTALKPSDIKSINSDISSMTKSYKEIRQNALDLERLGKMKNAPAQIAMVFKFMKALDPQSVVREGEFATAQNATGVDDRVINTYNRLLSGERLNDEQVKQFVSVAKGLSNAAAGGVESSVTDYLDTYGDLVSENTKQKFMKRAKVEVFDGINPIKPVKQDKEGAPQFTGQNLEAYNWAKSNPNDPRAAQILQRLGVQ